MKATEIEKLLDKLSPALNADEYNLQLAAGNLYYAKSSSGNRCAVLKYPSSADLPSGRATKGLSLQYFNGADFLIDGKPTKSKWAVVECLDASYSQMFSVLAEGILQAVVNNKMQEPKEILDYISDWQELLAAPAEFGFNQYIGLWGELQFILLCPSAEKAVEVWEGPKKKKFDFSGNGVDIEVKTSLKGHYHNFSMEQLFCSASGSKRYIYSIHAEEDPAGGKTAAELVNIIRAKLPLLEQFEKKLIAYGYNSSVDFKIPLSIRSAELISINDVPKVQSWDTGVYNIKFESDLAFSSPVKNYKSVVKKLLEN